MRYAAIGLVGLPPRAVVQCSPGLRAYQGLVASFRPVKLGCFVLPRLLHLARLGENGYLVAETLHPALSPIVAQFVGLER